ncbi:hypothetical protein [Amycolatopsis nigrescens]|uniref:hypothetical protein n=1 Tax=Amycolatopsis nigrescens TaxID=381445 RepID=UPI00036BFA82|nr:hypothetical protein [Amycolatopsis nigrescens]
MKNIKAKLASVATVVLAAGLVGGVLTGTANAAPLKLKYKVTGAAHVVKMNTDIPIDATVDVELDLASGNFTSKFKQDTAPHVAFKAFGTFDSELDVEFFEAAPSSGKFVGGKVENFTLPLQIRLKNLTALGFPLLVGDACEQKEAPTLTLGSTGPFDPAKGGDLATTTPYTLSEWSDACGFSTFLINMNSAGPDNTANVKLAKV